MYAPVAKVQSCANHVHHVGRSSHAASLPSHGRDSSAFKFDTVEITFILASIHGLFYSILGCILPLQEIALRQSLPSFSVLCYPHPYRSLLPHNVISPTTFWSSGCLTPSVCHSVLLIVHLLSYPLSATLCF